MKPYPRMSEDIANEDFVAAFSHKPRQRCQGPYGAVRLETFVELWGLNKGLGAHYPKNSIRNTHDSIEALTLRATRRHGQDSSKLRILHERGAFAGVETCKLFAKLHFHLVPP